MREAELYHVFWSVTNPALSSISMGALKLQAQTFQRGFFCGSKRFSMENVTTFKTIIVKIFQILGNPLKCAPINWHVAPVILVYKSNCLAASPITINFLLMQHRQQLLAQWIRSVSLNLNPKSIVCILRCYVLWKRIICRNPFGNRNGYRFTNFTRPSPLPWWSFTS